MRAHGGTTLSPEQASAAEKGIKALLRVGRPFLDYVLSALADAQLTEVCIVIGPEHDVIRDYYSSIPLQRITISFAVQEKPLGTADAILATESFAAGQTFIALNSDSYYPVTAYRAVREMGEPGLIAFDADALIREGNILRERIQSYALLDVGADQYLRRIVEKPDPESKESFGKNAPVSMNLWSFGPRIFEACRNIKPSPRGELEIQSAVSYAMENLGERFRAVPMAAGVLDLSYRSDVSTVANRLAGMNVRL